MKLSAVGGKVMLFFLLLWLGVLFAQGSAPLHIRGQVSTQYQEGLGNSVIKFWSLHPDIRFAQDTLTVISDSSGYYSLNTTVTALTGAATVPLGYGVQAAGDRLIVTTPVARLLELTLYNVLGEQVGRYRHSLKVGTNIIFPAILSVASGMYFYELRTSGQRTMGKLTQIGDRVFIQPPQGIGGLSGDRKSFSRSLTSTVEVGYRVSHSHAHPLTGTATLTTDRENTLNLTVSRYPRLEVVLRDTILHQPYTNTPIILWTPTTQD